MRCNHDAPTLHLTTETLFLVYYSLNYASEYYSFSNLHTFVIIYMYVICQYGNYMMTNKICAIIKSEWAYNISRSNTQQGQGWDGIGVKNVESTG